jgi:propanediol dehydratase small subunit
LNDNLDTDDITISTNGLRMLAGIARLAGRKNVGHR